MIEKKFDIPFAAEMALKEKQIQQNYRPIIAVHKWFARRPGTMFRSLMLSEFSEGPLKDNYFKSNDIGNKIIADPFMGGGTPLFEANRIGADTLGFDINPMAWWIVTEELKSIDIKKYDTTFQALIDHLKSQFGMLYETKCPLDKKNYPVKYFIWVKTKKCSQCKSTFDLSPGDVVAKPVRHTAWVLSCGNCKKLYESEDNKNASCPHCKTKANLSGTTRGSYATCTHCGHKQKITPSDKPYEHRLLALEYAKPNEPRKKGRWFKAPDTQDLSRVEQAAQLWGKTDYRYVPDDDILEGDETTRLHKWGYKKFKQLFNARQLLLLEHAAKFIAQIEDKRIKHALATNFSDLLRYQNMLCRYDTMALKSLDIFSVHGFPVGLVRAESNMFGIANAKGAPIGSGGWFNIWSKFRLAKTYCDTPFEIQKNGKRKKKVYTKKETIGDQTPTGRKKKIELICGSSTNSTRNVPQLDAVFTDPPYFGNVQYSELMDFCYVWLRRLIDDNGFGQTLNTRSIYEVSGNKSEGRGLEHYTEGLSKVFCRFAEKLKAEGPFVFTFHHNDPKVYAAVATAILNSGMDCSAAIPCPAEMSASIHIKNTASSILDTIFVCRKKRQNKETETLPKLITNYKKLIEQANVPVSIGSERCLIFGLCCKTIINELHDKWDKCLPVEEKINSCWTRLSTILNELGIK